MVHFRLVLAAAAALAAASPLAAQQNVTTFGQGCGVGVATWSAVVHPGGADLNLILGNVPAGGIAALMFGVQGTQIDLAPFGATGCSILVDPTVMIPVPVTSSFAFYSLHVPPAIAATIGPTVWQYGYTGESNALGVGTTEGAVITMN